ncbi:MAG: AAA family ATPase [Nitrosopumilus sp. H13]|nr:MAG: AAA family ATPase [Nitrosopumilus sp. H13]
MSDPVDQIIDSAKDGKSILKDRSILHFTHIPNTIFHRDAEQKKVTQSLLPILKHSKPSNLLVYGKPGTGKTLVVKKIISKIQERVDQSKFPTKLIYTNAKNESTTTGLLISAGRQLGLDEKELPMTGLATGEVFKRLLDRIDKNSLNMIFVIDEIDYLAQLITKTHKDTMYQLTRANERLKHGSLALVGISNDLKFKEILDARVISSLSEEEVVFTNYNVDQLTKILNERVGEAFAPDSVEESALGLCAAMAAKVHGDARRAIDLIRVAGEIAEREQADKVTTEHVRAASQKIEENKEETALKSYPLHEKLVVMAVMKAPGASTGEVYAAYKDLCKATAQDPLSQRRVTQMLNEVEVSGLVDGRIVHQGMHGRTKKYRLTIPTETVRRAFKDDLSLEDVI